MEPSSIMLPYILIQARFSPTQYMELQGPTPFQYRREPPSIVPQLEKKKKKKKRKFYTTKVYKNQTLDIFLNNNMSSIYFL